ncbi:MAG: hypothetical protein JSS65_06515 [Armatimonadetes bacterium]|nr:hypothetical protein [Armatimonadota bacterium]
MPYEKASLIWAGTSFPVQMKSSDAAGTLEFKLTAHGEDLMTETYKHDGASFSFVGSTGETYEPPIPLMSFPLNSTERKSWKGTIKVGDATEPGEATITSTKDNLNLAGGKFDSVVKIEVALSYKGGGKTETHRALKFWFAPKKGMVKREFGMSSSREPLPDFVADTK